MSSLLNSVRIAKQNLNYVKDQVSSNSQLKEPPLPRNLNAIDSRQWVNWSVLALIWYNYKTIQNAPKQCIKITPVGFGTKNTPSRNVINKVKIYRILTIYPIPNTFTFKINFTEWLWGENKPSYSPPSTIVLNPLDSTINILNDSSCLNGSKYDTLYSLPVPIAPTRSPPPPPTSLPDVEKSPVTAPVIAPATVSNKVNLSKVPIDLEKEEIIAKINEGLKKIDELQKILRNNLKVPIEEPLIPNQSLPSINNPDILQKGRQWINWIELTKMWYRFFLNTTTTPLCLKYIDLTTNQPLLIMIKKISFSDNNEYDIEFFPALKKKINGSLAWKPTSDSKHLAPFRENNYDIVGEDTCPNLPFGKILRFEERIQGTPNNSKVIAERLRDKIKAAELEKARLAEEERERKRKEEEEQLRLAEAERERKRKEEEEQLRLAEAERERKLKEERERLEFEAKAKAIKNASDEVDRKIAELKQRQKEAANEAKRKAIQQQQEEEAQNKLQLQKKQQILEKLKAKAIAKAEEDRIQYEKLKAAAAAKAAADRLQYEKQKAAAAAKATADRLQYEKYTRRAVKNIQNAMDSRSVVTDFSSISRANKTEKTVKRFPPPRIASSVTTTPPSILRTTIPASGSRLLSKIKSSSSRSSTGSRINLKRPVNQTRKKQQATGSRCRKWKCTRKSR